MLCHLPACSFRTLQVTPLLHQMQSVCLSAHVCSGVRVDASRGSSLTFVNPPSCSHLRLSHGLPPPQHLLPPPPRGRHTPCVVSPEQKLVPPLVGPFGHVLEDKRTRWRCEAFQVLPAAVKPPQEEEESSSTGPPLPHCRDTDTRGNLLTFNL